jgi:hypothetical protein
MRSDIAASHSGLPKAAGAAGSSGSGNSSARRLIAAGGVSGSDEGGITEDGCSPAMTTWRYDSRLCSGPVKSAERDAISPPVLAVRAFIEPRSPRIPPR